MKRRDFLTAAAGALAGPFVAAARAQQATPSIGFLSSRSPGDSAEVVAAFRKGLEETGFIEGRNVAIAFRWAEGRYERLRPLAMELVNLRVNLLFAAGGPPAALAAKAATPTIPIVFSATSDPVGTGLVASLNRPGGNVTGMSVFNATLGAKRLELLKELMPAATEIAYLANPSLPTAALEVPGVRAAATALKIKLHDFSASSDDQLEAAFSEATKARAAALFLGSDPFFDSRLEKLVALAAKHALPTCYPWREYVAAGGLASYGTSLPGAYQQAGTYAGRILRGESAADLPVMQPTKFELAINLKTAKALGIAAPNSILARADEVIE
jgi:putative tryptophan/tyrosine transport system substrate-binding protein